MNINTVCISGNFVKDPVVYNESSPDKKFAKFTLAVNNSVFNNETGEWDNDPAYVDCVAFRGIVNAIKLAKKGTKAFVSGRLRTNRWEKDGKKYSKLELVVNRFEFSEPKTAEVQTKTADCVDEELPF